MNPIKAMMTERGLTQAELADLVGVSQGHISLVCKNVHVASRSLVVKISEALGYPSESVLGMHDSRKIDADKLLLMMLKLGEKEFHAVATIIESLGGPT